MPASPLPFPEIPPAPPTRIRWRCAFRALRALIADAEDTAKAQDLFMAIGGRQNEAAFQRFVASPSGRRLLADRPSLLDALSDRAGLAAMPEGSLGRAYLAYVDAHGFTPRGLVDLERETRRRWTAEGAARPDEIRAWYRERVLLVHDITHLLTEYPTDGVGEATLLAFNLAQEPGRAGALLTLGAAFELWRRLGAGWLAYDYRAWRRGRRALWLWDLPWERLLPIELDALRALLGIAATEDAHPQGILRDPPT